MKFLTIYALMEKEENQYQEKTTAETLNESEEAHKPVSYTHLTLPTILLV